MLPLSIHPREAEQLSGSPHLPSLLGFASEASLPLMWPTSGIEVGVALGLRELGGCPGPRAARQPAALGGHPSSPGRAHAWLRLLRGLGAAPLPTQAWVLKSYSPSHLGHCRQTPELPDSVSASVTLEGLRGYCASRVALSLPRVPVAVARCRTSPGASPSPSREPLCSL